MIDKPLLLTGMFRSGTTLLARMLNAHPEIILASDPFARLFKAFRNEVVRQVLGLDQFDQASPLDDYYYYPDKQRVMAAVQRTGLELSFPRAGLPKLREIIASASKPFSPLIENYVQDLDGSSFQELFASGLDILRRAYSKPGAAITGFKEVWAGEFAGPFLRAFPGAKVVHILRDPKAVCASNQATREKYPLLFLTRQWRKLSTFAWLDERAFPDRVLLLKYEDLILRPEQEARRICLFLGLEPHPAVTDPTRYVDGQGAPWRQNSSHFQGGQGFNDESLKKWKQVLSPKQIEFIESLCHPEMCCLGYADSKCGYLPLPPSQVLEPLALDNDDLADWIKPYIPGDTASYIRETAMEYLRGQILALRVPVDEEQQRRLCLHLDFYRQASLHYEYNRG